MTDAIIVRDLMKRFGEVEALKGISFSVRTGEVFGLLGPNGAGKSTTINLLIGLARSDSGSKVIGGIDCTTDPRAAQRLIGVVPDESNLYPELDGFDNLCFCGALYGMTKRQRESRASQLLNEFDLLGAAKRRFAGYSKGMKRRLTIAAGMMHSPPILFLDEPTTGLDVQSARQLRELITRLRKQGTTIFLTTHNIAEAESLCDRVAFIVAGRIVKLDRVEALIQPATSHHVMLIACKALPPNIVAGLNAAIQGLVVSEHEGGTIRIESMTPVPVGPVVRFLESKGATVTEARRVQPSLEDVFVEATGIAVAAMRPPTEQAEAP